MSGDRPFIGLGLHKIQEGGKIGLPSNIEEYVPWCVRGEEHICLARANGVGGVTIFPPKVLKRDQDTLKKAGSRSLQPEDLPTARARALRALAESWQVTVTKSGVITLPMDARRMGMLPPPEPKNDETQYVAVVALGDAVELWDPHKLQEEMQATAKQLRELLERADLLE